VERKAARTMEGALRVLIATLLCMTGSAIHPPPPPSFNLNGACAGVKQRETWNDLNGQPSWSYRIKVAPWTVFGKVHVQLHGWDMALTKNYSASIVFQGKSFTAVLHPTPGLDDTFQLIGSGEPYADPMLTCADLEVGAMMALPDALHVFPLPLPSVCMACGRSPVTTTSPSLLCVHGTE
jgi:hypothetical protein